MLMECMMINRAFAEWGEKEIIKFFVNVQKGGEGEQAEV